MAALFSEVLTVSQFKESQKTAGIELVNNPNPNKSGYMRNDAGVIIGAISSKIRSNADITRPVIGITADGTAVLFNAAAAGTAFGSL